MFRERKRRGSLYMLINWFKRLLQWREIDILNRKPLGWGIEWPDPPERDLVIEANGEAFVEYQPNEEEKELKCEYLPPTKRRSKIPKTKDIKLTRKEKILKRIAESKSCEIVSIQNRLRDCLNPNRYADQEPKYSNSYALITIRIEDKISVTFEYEN